MDLSVTWRTKRRVAQQRWSAEWNLSLYNAYSRHNAWSIAFTYSKLDEEPQAAKIYLFTVIPSLSCNIQF